MLTLRKTLRLYKGMIVPVVVILIAFFGAISGILPIAKDIPDLYQKTDKLAKENETLRSKVSLLDALDEETLRTQLSDLLKAVPSEKQVPSVFTSTEDLVSRAGLTIVDFTVKSPGNIATDAAERVQRDERVTGSNVLGFSLSTRGTLEQMQSYLQTVPTVRRMLRVNTMNIHFPLKENDPPELMIDMYAFYTPFKEVLPKVSQPLPQLSQKEEEIITAVSSMPLAGIESVEAAEMPSVPAKADPFAK